MNEPQKFTDQAGRTFQYVRGHRVYLDGGEDIGTPVPYPAKYYPDELPPLLPDSLSPNPVLLLEKRRLSKVLEKRLGVRVPVTTLLACKDGVQEENAVMMLLPEPGKTHEERQALGRRITDLGMFCYRWTMHEVICDFVCLNCDRRLGAEALRLAKEYNLRVMRDAHARSQGMLITVWPDTAAVCPHCGERYVYTDTRTLVAKD